MQAPRGRTYRHGASGYSPHIQGQERRDDHCQVSALCEGVQIADPLRVTMEMLFLRMGWNVN
jgi:hypothetical protein